MDGQVIGSLTVQSYQKGLRYQEQDVQLLEFVGQHIAVALTRARALEKTRQRNTELAVINSVQEGLASRLDMQAIYELIGEKVREVFHVEVIDIVNYDPAANLISMPYSYEKGDRSVFLPREPYGFRRQVIESRAPLLINQNFEELASQAGNPLLTGAWPKSALFVPLLVEGQVKSIISIQDLECENAFSASDVQLLETLSNAMAVALENARLFDETERLLRDTEQRAQELATINTVGSALAGELHLNTLIELVGEQIRSVFKADVAFVALLDKEKSTIHFPYQYGQQLESMQLGQGLTSKIIRSGKPLLINEEMDRQRQEMKVKLIGKRALSFLGVPIFVAGEAIGVVSVQSTTQEGRFTENDQRLLSTIAANVGSAFQNAHLFHEAQRLFQAERRAHEQAETLRSVAQALNRSLSLTEVFHLVLTEIQKVIPYDSAGIYQVHGNHRVLVAGRGFANLEDLIGVSFEFNQQEDEIGYLISRSLQPLVLADAPEKYPQYFSTGSHAATKIRSYMAVPILLGQKLIGMITLDREEPGFYTDEHAGLAMAFAAQAATAINNAQLFDETQQRNAELAIINSVQEGLASTLDFDSITELVGNKILEIFDADVISIGIYDSAHPRILYPYVFDHAERFYPEPLLNHEIISYISNLPEPIIIHSYEGFRKLMEAWGIHNIGGPTPDNSHIILPIRKGDQFVGSINLAKLPENAFSISDVRLLETLANSMSVALENARLWEQEKLYRKALERELEIGREIQAGFLPEVLPQIEGWEIAAALMSAREVAGDFYDMFELPDGTIGLVIADVCGKGVGAALFMTLFRSLIRVSANQDYFEHMKALGASTAERLHRAVSLTNNYIAETHETSAMFATLFFCILNPRDGKLAYINGGHEPPLIVQSGTVREILSKTGPAVGAMRNGCFDVLQTQLFAGDILFAYTDGVLDCTNPRDEFFGRQRMLDVLQRTGESSHELVQCLQSELQQFNASATQFDDITLLAVRRI
jgi:GAF domain-containing protein